MALKDEAKKLNDEQTEKVSGGSHFSWDELQGKVGQKLMLSWGIGAALHMGGPACYVTIMGFEENDYGNLVIVSATPQVSKYLDEQLRDEYLYNTNMSVYKRSNGIYVVNYTHGMTYLE